MNDEQTLPFRVKLCFGIGAVGEAIYFAIFIGFITIFYNQAIGLPNYLIGIATMLAVATDAVTDPFIGMLSDHHRSRLGRRHPFLWSAPVPLALSIFAIFNPPDVLIGNEWGLFLWLAVWTVLSRAFVTLFNVPHLALGAELSKHHHERSQLFSANAMFTYIAGSGFGFFAWTMFQGERVRASDGALVPGQLDPAAYVPIVLTVCAVILITIFICALGTQDYGRSLTQMHASKPRFSILFFLKSLFRTLKNYNNLILLGGYFFFMIASGIYDKMNVFIQTYLWQLEPNQIRLFPLVGVAAGLSGALLAPWLMKKFDRKPVMLCSLFGIGLFAQLVVNLRLLGILPENGDPYLLPSLLANAAGFALSISICAVAIMSMIGDIIDENELVTGLREEGLFYSARLIFGKGAYSVATLFAGFMLDFYVRLPEAALPGELEQDVLTRLAITAGPIMGASALVSFAIYSFYKLTHARHTEILATLAARRAASRDGAKNSPDDTRSTGVVP